MWKWTGTRWTGSASCQLAGMVKGVALPVLLAIKATLSFWTGILFKTTLYSILKQAQAVSFQILINAKRFYRLQLRAALGAMRAH
jgi:hypothetical protein